MNVNGAKIGGVDIFLVSKSVIKHGALYSIRVVRMKTKMLEGDNLGIVCIYTPNIFIDKRHLWHILTRSLPNDCIEFWEEV